MIDVLLYACDKFNESDNKEYNYSSSSSYHYYIKFTKRFQRPLIDHCLL